MNTFWTLIDNQYYRVHNGILKYAPMCNTTNQVITEQESIVEVISAIELEKINMELGSNFIAEDFK